MAIRFAIGATLVALLVADAGVAAAEPASARDTLRHYLDSLFATLQSRAFLAKDAEGRRDAVRGVSDRLFNWEELSRRALGARWKERTPAERRRFTAQFARVAERSYLWQVDRMRPEHVIHEPVRYLEESVDGHETIVHTRLAYLRDLPADFRMRQRGGRWEVCDVALNGVSVAENYRAQFDRVLARDSYPTLVERMTSQVSEPAGGASVLPAR